MAEPFYQKDFNIKALHQKNRDYFLENQYYIFHSSFIFFHPLSFTPASTSKRSKHYLTLTIQVYIFINSLKSSLSKNPLPLEDTSERIHASNKSAFVNHQKIFSLVSEARQALKLCCLFYSKHKDNLFFKYYNQISVLFTEASVEK